MAFFGMIICCLCEYSGSYASCEIQYKDGSLINLRAYLLGYEEGWAPEVLVKVSKGGQDTEVDI